VGVGKGVPSPREKESGEGVVLPPEKFFYNFFWCEDNVFWCIFRTILSN